MIQDLSQYDGVDSYYGFVFYVACAVLLLSCCTWGGMVYAFSKRTSKSTGKPETPQQVKKPEDSAQMIPAAGRVGAATPPRRVPPTRQC